MPPKKKGAKKGSKGKTHSSNNLLGKQDEDEFLEDAPDHEQPQPVQETQLQQSLPQAQHQQQQQLQQQHQPESRQVTMVTEEVKQHETRSEGITAVDDSLQTLSLKERRELRLQRFKLDGAGGTHLNTLDAIQNKKEEDERKRQRALKFGLPVEEDTEDKRKARMVKFGIQPAASKDELDEKRQARAVKFGVPGALSKDEEAEKRKKRLERFGGGGKSLDDVIAGSRVVKRLKQ